MHTHIHTYIHTYIPTYLPTYLHTYIHTYITYIHTYIHTYIYTIIPIRSPISNTPCCPYVSTSLSVGAARHGTARHGAARRCVALRGAAPRPVRATRTRVARNVTGSRLARCADVAAFSQHRRKEIPGSACPDSRSHRDGNWGWAERSGATSTSQLCLKFCMANLRTKILDFGGLTQAES